MVTWYNPALPAVRTVLITWTATPPTSTVGAVTTAGAPLTAVPAGTAGFVAPKPVPHSTRVSPAFAATVPGIADGSPISAQSGSRAGGGGFFSRDTKEAGVP